MSSFFERVFSLLTSDTGNLTVNLVLAFSIAGAWQASMGRQRSSSLVTGKRLVVGLGILLALRLVMFFLAVLSSQDLLDAELFLPLIDRAISMLSLLLVIWLWAFPDKSRLADLATLLLTLLTLALSVMSGVWVAAQIPSVPFQGSAVDRAGELYALILIGIGVIALLVRRPWGWGFGMGMLVLILSGHAIYLFSLSGEKDFFGVIRLAQLTAYPLLLILPERVSWAVPSFTSAEARQPGASNERVIPEPQALESALLLVSETSWEKILIAVTPLITRLTGADLCLVVSIPEKSGQVVIHSSYGLRQDQGLPVAAIESRLIPVLTFSLRRRQSVRLPANSSSPDLKGLAKALKLPHAGSLLAVPLEIGDANPLWGIILLSPDSNRAWTAEDQVILSDISRSLAPALQRARQLEGMKTLQDQVAQTSQATQVQLDQILQEKQQLQEQFNQLQQAAGQDKTQLESLVAVVAAQRELQETIAQLQSENEELKQTGQLDSHQQAEEIEHLEGELRLALEEVASLRLTLAEVDRKSLVSGESLTRTPLIQERIDAILSIANELRQPMASTLGYVDFLLGESVGILGALQRKFLDRIKISTERMGRLVDELIQATNRETQPIGLHREPLDVNVIVEGAIQSTDPQFKAKQITLQVEVEEKLPRLDADRQAVQQVLSRLLQNAGAVTVERGLASLRVRKESSEGKDDYVLFQVTDLGGGIPPEDLPRVFSQIYQGSEESIPGIAESRSELFRLKSLVEALGGRIWVDSRFGQGSTFSVVLLVSPVATPVPGGNGD